MKPKEYPYGICHKNISARPKSVYCNNCNLWFHIKCNNISISDYHELEKENDNISWFYLKCTPVMFPFGTLDNDELLDLYSCSFPSWVDKTPSFQITSELLNLLNLDDYDIDEHISSNVSSSYHTHSPGLI